MQSRACSLHTLHRRSPEQSFIDLTCESFQQTPSNDSTIADRLPGDPVPLSHRDQWPPSIYRGLRPLPPEAAAIFQAASALIHLALTACNWPELTQQTQKRGDLFKNRSPPTIPISQVCQNQSISDQSTNTPVHIAFSDKLLILQLNQPLNSIWKDIGMRKNDSIPTSAYKEPVPAEPEPAPPAAASCPTAPARIRPALTSQAVSAHQAPQLTQDAQKKGDEPLKSESSPVIPTIFLCNIQRKYRYSVTHLLQKCVKSDFIQKTAKYLMISIACTDAIVFAQICNRICTDHTCFAALTG